MLLVNRIKKLSGEVNLPGDKSISHRAAILASIAVGESKLLNYSKSLDCLATLDCLESLGASISIDTDSIKISGQGKDSLRRADRMLDCKNSGTTMRLLAGILAGQDFSSQLIGDESLNQRPMQRIIDPLEKIGAEIESDNGLPPIKIRRGKTFIGQQFNLQIASAQVKSAILFAGLYADGKTRILNPPNKYPIPSSRDHSERMLRYLGAQIEQRFIPVNNGFIQYLSIQGDWKLTGTTIDIPADVSSAAFLIVGASLLNGSKLNLRNVGINQTRSTFLRILEEIGVQIELSNRRTLNLEERADIQIFGNPEKLSKNAVKISGDIIPNVIDEIPILAILGTSLLQGIEIRDAGELRLKESDRIAALVKNLRAMGATIEEYDDGFKVSKSKLQGATIETNGDHRIAMAFAIAGLNADGQTEIDDPNCAGISFPGFFDELNSVSIR